MDKFDKLVKQIMAEAEEDGEPVSREEAEEMAKMELGAQDMKNYTQATVEKKTKKPRERKVDETKKKILTEIKVLLEGIQLNSGIDTDVIMENETDLHFTYGGEKYSLKLTKHRPKK